MRKYIEDADCIVLPSYREGTPRTLLEAASSSKPIITTDVPGCNQVVTNNYNGLLCKSKDPVDLANKMQQMASFSDEKLDSLGRNGRLKVQAEYDESFVIKKYVQALQEIKNTSSTIDQEAEKNECYLGMVLSGLARTNAFLIHPKNVLKIKLRVNRVPIWSKNDIRKRLNINPKNILHYGLIRR